MEQCLQKVIVRYLEVQVAVLTVLRSTELAKMKSRDNLDTLSDADMSLCEELVDCLRDVKAITTMLCAERSPTVSLIMPLLTDLTQNKLKLNKTVKIN